MGIFQLHSPFPPAGDQPEAIRALRENLRQGTRYQTLRGVTGSGKTFVLANAIAANAQVAVRQSKAAIRRGLQTDMATGTAYESEAFGLCFATEDQKDAMKAFVNKEKVTSFKNR